MLKKSPEYGFNVDLSKAGNSNRLTGLLDENELPGILQASDFDAADNVFSFLGALANSMCGLLCTAEVTCAMTEYVDMVNFVFRRHMDINWTVETIQDL